MGLGKGRAAAMTWQPLSYDDGGAVRDRCHHCGRQDHVDRERRCESCADAGHAGRPSQCVECDRERRLAERRPLSFTGP